MEPNAPSTGESPLRGKKVFIVEDDAFLGTILSQRIASDLAESVVFPNGEEALEALKNDTPDIIVLDVMLPGMDGFQVLENIKNNPKTKNIPVLIVSNAHQPESQERAKNMGTDFIMKALTTPLEIVEKIKHKLAHPR